MESTSKVKHLDVSIVGRISQIAQELLNAPEIDGTDVSSENVPSMRGVYLWRFKSGEPAYVGVANGLRGLRGRIVRQHLGAHYSKSVLRRSIAKAENLEPNAEATAFIRTHMTLAFVPCGDDSPAIVAAAEAMVVAMLCPKYNKITAVVS